MYTLIHLIKCLAYRMFTLRDVITLHLLAAIFIATRLSRINYFRFLNIKELLWLWRNRRWWIYNGACPLPCCLFQWFLWCGFHVKSHLIITLTRGIFHFSWVLCAFADYSLEILLLFNVAATLFLWILFFNTVWIILFLLAEVLFDWTWWINYVDLLGLVRLYTGG